MKRISVLIPAAMFGLLLLSCVTTGENAVEDTSSSVEKTESVSEVAAQTSEHDTSPEKPGIIYASRSLSDGPLLLGSTEHLTGPVMEFSLLYSIYFPLSGIEPSLSSYEPGEGTLWQVESDELSGTVYFERALLSVDDESKSWWFFRVQGDGFERIYEFLIDQQWKLLEMRYTEGGTVKSYYPSVDDVSDMAGETLSLDEQSSEKVRIETALGEVNARYIASDESEYWFDESTTGKRIRTVIKRDDQLLLSAELIEIGEDYTSRLGSY